MKLTTVGIVFGLAGAWATTGFLRSMLYGVEPTDPFTLVSVASILLTVGALGSYLPARRATKVNPAITLRSD
jgi:ABC-type antimicrobial peptide transport system permease subunit